jgi:hypothetical protein
MQRLLLLVLCVVMQASGLGAQATSVIAGRVVRAGSSVGIIDAEVTLALPPHAS